MRALHIFLICGLFGFAATLPAAAEPKGPKGEKCDITELRVKHEIKGKPYICDKCVFSKCDSSGRNVSNCQKVTHWSECEEPPAPKPAPKVDARPTNTKLTAEQVKTVCGSKLQTKKSRDSETMGCERECGLKKEKMCSYSCVTKDGKQTCSGLLF